MENKGNVLIGSGVILAVLGFLGDAALERTHNENALNLERERRDAELILAAVDPEDLARTRETLRFYAKAGLVSDPDALLENLEKEDFLPRSEGAIACYSHSSAESLYPISGDDTTFVMGFVEGLPGRYDGNGIFRPKGYERADISGLAHFKELCQQGLPQACPTADSCWAGGATGGLYGYPRTGGG